MLAHLPVARAEVLMRRLSQGAILIHSPLLVTHGLLQLLQALLSPTVGIKLPFGIGHDSALHGRIDNFEMADKGVGIVEVCVHRGLSFLDVTWVGRRTPDNEAPERSHADGDALGHVYVLNWSYNKHSADVAL